jgi:SAM-dependent methyltransferase
VTERYDPQAFWDRTLADHFHLPGIALATFPASLNRAWYASTASSLDRLLDDQQLRGSLKERSVLDVGPGIGMWIDFWRTRGVQDLVGLDITSAGFERLHGLFPDAVLVRGDIGDAGLEVARRFDIISVASVLLHVTDDSKWEQALSNLARLLAPGGLLLVVDVPIFTTARGGALDETSIERRRHIRQWQQALNTHGLAIVGIAPATVLLSPPIEARTNLSWSAWWFYWRALMKLATGRGEIIGRIIALPLGVVDRALIRVVPRGPAAKCLAIRRLN